MKYVPQEISSKIIDHVAKHEDYLSRQDLRNLRLVNKYFCHLATPPLFQTVPFWLGLNSLEHLTLISEHAQMYDVYLIYQSRRLTLMQLPICYKARVLAAQIRKVERP